jgi:hypothetical protein
MKTIKIISFILTLFLVSCSSVRVGSDFDSKIDFTQFKTYAYHKSGIDKAEISDLDKKRILRAIDNEMATKGFTKSENPDVLINIFTKERERVNVNQFNMGWGWAWNPWLWGNTASTTTYTEGTLYIDIIQAKNKELIWQGEGIGVITRNSSKKEERINEFVSKILAQYPPTKK